jgi:hypothetical protein
VYITCVDCGCEVPIESDEQWDSMFAAGRGRQCMDCAVIDNEDEVDVDDGDEWF